MKNFIELAENYGNANDWKGYVGLYFTQKDMRILKKLGVNNDMTIKQAYKVLTSK